MGNSYMLWGKVRDVKTFRGTSQKFQNNYCITTFLLEHPKDNSKLTVKCKSYREVVSDISLKDGMVVELTSYYPKNEKFTNQYGYDNWTQWIIVDEFAHINMGNIQPQPAPAPQPPQYQPFVKPQTEITQDEKVDDGDIVSLDFLNEFIEPTPDELKKQRQEMLAKEQQRLNNQPPAPNWESVEMQTVEIEKVKNSNEW